MYLAPNRRTLAGLGLAITAIDGARYPIRFAPARTVPIATPPAPARPPVVTRPYPMPAPAQTLLPPRVSTLLPARPPIPRPPVQTAPLPAQTSIVAGTPVPVNYPTTQFYVAPDGSVWQYSSGQHTWLNQGKPYNVNTPTAAPSTSPNPVPAGYPTSAAYTDSSGNIWTWNGTTWLVSGSVYSGGQLTPAAAAGGVTPPVSVNLSPATDSYQTILNWLTEHTLIGGIPNWVIAAGVGLVGFKILQEKGGR